MEFRIRAEEDVDGDRGHYGKHQLFAALKFNADAFGGSPSRTPYPAADALHFVGPGVIPEMLKLIGGAKSSEIARELAFHVMLSQEFAVRFAKAARESVKFAPCKEEQAQWQKMVAGLPQ